ncbi:MAG: DNA mismatch repair endonuclease MutL [Clostridia bacterium]|nr:DNA mismatch repair endonuclease MutL [Clostridia bacterium]
MAKIQLLNENVSSRIAAGEVVERPASVVKELVENSIDAGAKNISVSVTEGGLRSITVSDNGEGMSREDLPLSVLKHATSKIYTLQDLEHINSMGFRGEALSSIAAVSMVEIRTKTPDDELGTILVNKGGRTESIKDAGLSDGTTVTVENLFFNTPARKKFMRKPSLETAYINDILSKLVLSHPDISFRFTSDGKVQLQSPGNGVLRDAVYSIYGTELKDQLIDIDYSFNSIFVRGVIGLPSLTYRTMRHGTLFINSRYVKNDFVFLNIKKAYGERLMKHNFPFYVLNIIMPPEDVDVNVHPTKMAVDFRDKNEIEYVITNAVGNALNKNEYAKEISFSSSYRKKEEKAPTENSAFIRRYDGKTEDKSASEQTHNPNTKPAARDKYRPDPKKYENIETIINLSKEISDRGREEEDISDQPPLNEAFNIPTNTETGSKPVQSLFSDDISFRVAGTIFKTYIVVECPPDTVYLIDQHAAHERKIYDELMKSVLEKKVSQRLLSPIRFEVSAEERYLILENMDVIKDMGFDFSDEGEGYFDLIEYPQVLGQENIRQTFQDMIKQMDEGGSFEIRKDKIAKGACKRAIKGGMDISEADIKELILTIRKTGTIPHCPHGRPLSIALTRSELEKTFGREE